MSAANGGRLVFLDYMRVFAFISVLVGHKFAEELSAAVNNPALHITTRYFFEALVPLCIGGAAGVVVFFLTSGYIITHVLQKETPTDFIIKRIFRIYPLFIFAVLSETFMAWYFHETPVPPLSVMVPRLLLIGDFFDIPNALAGVEWTLRIEILFYILMATFKSAGLFTSQKLLPIAYLIVATCLYVIPAFPEIGHWNAAYVNTYSLFLFIGSLIYLSQQELANRKICIAVGSILSLMFLIKISNIQPGWKESNYAIIALALFLASLYYGPKLQDGRALRVISDLTFSVYLFHNWLWEYISTPVQGLGFTGISSKLIICALLFAVCYALHQRIEKPGLSLGAKVLRLRHARVEARELVSGT
ncbi:acyltransferase [Pseudomonas sp. WJP1]|uniref:acyltransferase family protein n=1 Tax=Pseudomonas sp. WJP1 TaxID=2986947 RepID=UPI00234B771E|nr:acyltransferase [Pseudomonas sp. WJP1]WCM48973.1 acyltransferase [Pseudomonas sp. WJP1]